MKLFRLTVLIQFLLTGLILCIAGSMIFQLLVNIHSTETYEKLLVNKERVVQQIEKGLLVADLKPIIEVTEVSNATQDTLYSKSQWIFDPIEKEKEHFMEVTSVENVGNKKYRISVRQVIFEKHDYTDSIIKALTLTFMILLISLLLINYFIARLTWRSFYRNLEIIKQFSLEVDSPIELHPSRITEFKVLNSTIVALADRVQKDYKSVKEFSEYASHEIQTPLAIIQAKQEEMLQDSNLSSKNATLIKHSLESIHRLTRMNKALLLITKIDNKQFFNNKLNDLGKIINKNIQEFTELIEQRGLTLITEIEEEIMVVADTSLLEVLISNLISNAIKHNNEGGVIKIHLDESKIEFFNNGKKYTEDTSKLFDRFAKGDPSSNSLGLGLTIVERICHLYNWKISYNYQAEMHKICIYF